MSPSTPSLVLITICRDNPEAVKMTLASVAQQSASPSRHIVIDSSHQSNKNTIAQYATLFGAEYSWTPPKGIYAAMEVGLEACADNDYVWFVNATDRLATPDSVQRVLDALETASVAPSGTQWWVGKTAVTHHRHAHLLYFPPSTQQWVSYLRNGKVGLPHPSVVTPARALRAVHAFQPPTTISEDYRIGLSLIREGFLPTPIDALLSVYDQSGVSGRYAWKTALAKARNRIGIQGLSDSVWEPIRLLDAGWRALLRGLWNITGSQMVFRALGWSRVDGNTMDIRHFCHNSDGDWPSCCSNYLLQ